MMGGGGAAPYPVETVSNPPLLEVLMTGAFYVGLYLLIATLVVGAIYVISYMAAKGWYAGKKSSPYYTENNAEGDAR